MRAVVTRGREIIYRGLDLAGEVRVGDKVGSEDFSSSLSAPMSTSTREVCGV